MVMAVCCLTASAQGKYAIGAEAGYASFQNSYSPTKLRTGVVNLPVTCSQRRMM